MRIAKTALGVAVLGSLLFSGASHRHRTFVGRMVTSVALVMGLATVPLLAGGAAASAATAKPTVISTSPGPFGTMLVVGSGKYAGYTLYFISSDQPGNFGCTTKKTNLGGGGPGTCTGPSNDHSAEWPAITTTGTPVAGTGVTQSLLGTVNRPKVGEQITYAGHPLYLFDQGPGQITGEAWDEPSLPPWHGVWYVMSAQGSPLPWAGTLTTDTIKNQTVLAALMFTGGGFQVIPVYADSADSAGTSSCTGSCAVTWPPLLTQGTPGLVNGLPAKNVGTLTRSDGTTQVTYDGKPLYLYSQEGVAKIATGYAATGSGNGVGGFSLVTP